MPSRATVFLVPLVFLLVGMVLRYAAFAAISDDGSFAAYSAALCDWDCVWYREIAELGYDGYPTDRHDNVGAWGFFPLYPMLIAAIQAVVPLPAPQLGMLVSPLLSFGACLASWRLLGRDLPAYALYCAFMLAGPFSVYFTMLMTESLFVLLACLVLLALQQGRVVAAGALLALLSATRIVGVFLFVALAWRIWTDHREAGGTVATLPRHILSRPDLLLAIFLAPAGLFTYMLYLYWLMGDGLAFSHVQRAFGRVFDLPWLFLWDGLTTTHDKGLWWPSPRQFQATAAIVALFLAAWVTVRRDFAAGLFCLIALVLPLTSGIASIVRYSAALAPLQHEASRLLSRNRILMAATLAAFMALCFLLTQQWIGDHLALV